MLHWSDRQEEFLRRVPIVPILSILHQGSSSRWSRKSTFEPSVCNPVYSQSMVLMALDAHVTQLLP